MIGFTKKVQAYWRFAIIIIAITAAHSRIQRFTCRLLRTGNIDLVQAYTARVGGGERPDLHHNLADRGAGISVSRAARDSPCECVVTPRSQTPRSRVPPALNICIIEGALGAWLGVVYLDCRFTWTREVILKWKT